MRKLEDKLQKYANLLVKRYPILKIIKQSVIEMYSVMEEYYKNVEKSLIAEDNSSLQLIESALLRGELLANNLKCYLWRILLVFYEELTSAYLHSSHLTLKEKVIGLSEVKKGELDKVEDIVIKALEMARYQQGLYLLFYHCWCLELENKFFEVQIQ